MQDGNSFLLQIRLNFIVDRTSGTDKKPQYLSRWKGVPPEVPLRVFPYNAVVELVNPVADTVSRKTYTGADVDWYVKAEDIVLKNKGNQNAGNPQNNNTQGQPKK